MLPERDSCAIGDTTQSPVTAWRDTPSPPRRTLGLTIVAGDARDPVLQVVRRRRTRLTDLVDDEQVVAVEAAQLVIERLAVALGLLEALDPLLGGADAERCPFWRVLIASAIARRWVLLVPGGGKEADVAALGDPSQLCELQDQRLLGAGLGGEVEALERLVGGKVARRMRWRAPEASRAKTPASSSVSRNCSLRQPSSRAAPRCPVSARTPRGALSLERIPNRRAISRCVTPSAAIALT
jgi:hypothetical protein